jgi:hypothetical protein
VFPSPGLAIAAQPDVRGRQLLPPCVTPRLCMDGWYVPGRVVRVSEGTEVGFLPDGEESHLVGGIPPDDDRRRDGLISGTNGDRTNPCAVVACRACQEARPRSCGSLPHESSDREPADPHVRTSRSDLLQWRWLFVIASQGPRMEEV